ncbi:MAG: hypothetical protein QOH06_2098 [Acidobacteriota bacterium]|jgi:hypothetical protein|nr:hypothetical protein [Acidobacteriota bacterium]
MKLKSRGEKRPKSSKKLVLHRDTLRALDPSMLHAVAGATVGGCDTGRTICWTNCASNCLC